MTKNTNTNRFRDIKHSFFFVSHQIRLTRTLNIGPEELVLDLGSGQSPNPRANVLCDKFIVDPTERAKRMEVVIDERPFVVGDAMRLPFQSNSFDFLICSHLIEHVEDPAQVLSEIQRVSKRGYIETPSRVHEKICGFPYHRWFVSTQDGKLVFEEKVRPIFDEELNRWWNQHLWNNQKFGDAVIKELYQLGLFTRYEWEGTISFEIIRSPEGAQKLTSNFSRAIITDDKPQELEISKTPLTLKRRIKNAYGKYLRRKSRKRMKNIYDFLACPFDQAILAPNTNRTGVQCQSCGRSFPIKDGIFYLLREFTY